MLKSPFVAATAARRGGGALWPAIGLFRHCLKYNVKIFTKLFFTNYEEVLKAKLQRFADLV